MKYLLLAVCGWLIATSLSAQFPSIQSTIAQIQCPYDNGTTVNQSTVYEFYRTVDDTYEGEIDSSWCADFQQDGINYVLDLSDFDSSRALFVTIRFPEDQGPIIQPYFQHEIQQSMWLDDASVAAEDDSCSGEFCNGIFLEYDFHDEVTNIDSNRFIAYELAGSVYLEEVGPTCFFSERFNEQRLRSLTLKMQIATNGPNPRLTPYTLELLEAYFTSQRIESITFGPEHYNGEGYAAYADEVIIAEEPEGFFVNYYPPQVEDALPSSDNYRYMDVNIIPNVDSVEDIELMFYQETLLSYPSFSGIRGGLVAGSDSLRHALTITMDDNFMMYSCLEIFFEVAIANNVTYRFGSGTIGLANKSSCFSIAPGGKFAIAANSHFNYGKANTATGLFATKPNGWVDLEPNSQLTINSNWQLAHPPNDPTAGSHVDLQPGSQLIFGKNATLFRSHPQGAGYLYVHLNGGSINVDALSPEERSLIRYVYPENLDLNTPLRDLTIYPNPASNYVEVVIPEEFINQQLEAQLFDATGRKLLTTTEVATDRLFSFPFGRHLPQGVYRLFVTNGAETHSAKLMVAH